MFYQSVMGWKNLQEWAQRVWAKHYQQSPVGSTQNVKPVIFQGGLGVEFIPSATENSPSDQSGPTSEPDANSGCRNNFPPASRHAASVSQKFTTTNQNEALNVAAQPANRSLAMAYQNEASSVAAQLVNQSSTLANQSELSNVTTQPANRSSIPANQNEVSNLVAQLANRSSAPANQSEALGITAGRGSGYTCCHGDAVNKQNLRNQLDVESPIERDLQAAARHRERLAMQARLEQTTKNNKKSRCMFTTSCC